MGATAKISPHGRQAVPLRMESWEVHVYGFGDKVFLEPMDTARTMPGDVIDALGDRQFMPDGREQPVMPSKRIIFDQ